ncbi:MAG TPA: hypothetical protein VN026_18660 [Bacteroidia bacterium]|jgi:hypothetical protein|nr:hypothetical protein [Bacteroidia bacterium]
MQLITKLIKDKPILFGVKYESEYKAVQKYKDFTFHFEKSFQADIEIVSSTNLNLILNCENGDKFEYLDLKFNEGRLRNFFNYVKPNTPFTFVHFYTHLDNELIAIDRYSKEKYVQVKGYTLTQQY